jgi:hypothetical protein
MLTHPSWGREMLNYFLFLCSVSATFGASAAFSIHALGSLQQSGKNFAVRSAGEFHARAPRCCRKRNIAFVVGVCALLIALAAGSGAQAQMFECPPGTTQVAGGGGIMCQCPDGSFSGLYTGCRGSYQQPVQPQIGDYCSDGVTCPVGTRCSWMPGRCVPSGQVDCGTYSCSPGNKCSSGGCISQEASDCGNGSHCDAGLCSRNGRMCLQADSVDCGSFSCNSGMKCGSEDRCLDLVELDCGKGKSCPAGSSCSRDRQHCVPAGGADCGSFTCGAGLKCSKRGNGCLSNDAVDCGSFTCNAGNKCGSANRCLAQNEVDCGGGKSCPVGNVCVNGGNECLTKEQLAKRVETEKLQKADEARRAKEAKEAETWLKKEKVRLAKETAEKKKADDAAAKKTEGQTKSTTTANPSTKGETAGTRSTPACITPIQYIDSVIVGKPLNDVPLCSGGGGAPLPSGGSIQQGTAITLPNNSGGAVLNSNLKDIQSLQPSTPAEARDNQRHLRRHTITLKCARPSRCLTARRQDRTARSSLVHLSGRPTLDRSPSQLIRSDH